VRQPLQEMGKVALRTAMRLATEGEVDSHHVELATELVVRQSTARAPSSPDHHLTSMEVSRDPDHQP